MYTLWASDAYLYTWAQPSEQGCSSVTTCWRVLVPYGGWCRMTLQSFWNSVSSLSLHGSVSGLSLSSRLGFRPLSSRLRLLSSRLGLRPLSYFHVHVFLSEHLHILHSSGKFVFSSLALFNGPPRLSSRRLSLLACSLCILFRCLFGDSL